MKKILLILPFLFILVTGLHAQCHPQIPPGAVVVNFTDTVNGGFDPLWVCSGDSLHTDGGFHNIYLEPGSLMTTGGGIDTIFVRNGASLYMNGGIHYIYYEKSADLKSLNGIPTLDSCAGMSFDYSHAPANGCFDKPVASFQSADSFLCAGSCINFTDMSYKAIVWKWLFPGGIPSGDSSQNPQQICYLAAGVYDVTLIVSDSLTSDTLVKTGFITIYAKPQAVITQIGNVLAATSGFVSYQWYADTVLLAGETNDSLVVTQIGNYLVLVTDSNSCDTTISFYYDNTGMVAISGNIHFLLSPNPAKDFIGIRITGDAQHDLYTGAEIVITNVTGQIKLDRQFSINQTKQISIKEFLPGIYFVTVKSGSSRLVKKMVVE